MYLLSFWQQLIAWDRSLFEKINGDWNNSLFDAVMPVVRNYLVWAPLYLFVFVYVILNYKSKGIWWTVIFLATIALTDMTGTYVFKHNIHRLRPCNDPVMIDQIRLLVNRCAGGYSFISNHAANHFGMGIFFYITFRRQFKWAWLGLAWAALIGYSQVYVGVHYPLDIICGALLGLICGYASARLFNNRFGFAIFGNSQPLA